MGGMGGNHMGNHNSNRNEQCGQHMCTGGDGGYNQCDMMTIQNLLQNRGLIQRDVKVTDTGVETTTVSLDTTVAGWIQVHVEQMRHRLLQDCPIRRWDPLFASIFANHENLTLDVTNQTDGVLVVESGDTQCAVSLIHSHANVVSNFLAYGHDEVMQSHDVPNVCLQETGYSNSSLLPSQETTIDPAETYWPSAASTSDTPVAPKTSNPSETKSSTFSRFHNCLLQMFEYIFLVNVFAYVRW
jgi:hypothetical protein